MKTFEDYLKEVHGKSYMGLDDDMPDAYQDWVSNLDQDEIIDIADKYAKLSYARGFADCAIQNIKAK